MNGRSHRRRPLAVILALAGSLVLIAAGGCGQPPTQSEPTRPVKTMVVAAGGQTHVRSFPGKVEASRAAELAFQVPGLLVSIPVKEGQRVAKGDRIAQLRQDEFQAGLKVLEGQLDQARAMLVALRSGERPEQQLRLESQVRAAEARMANARSELDRSIALLNVGGVSRENHERAETAYRVAQEEHQAALQMLEKGTIAREEDIEAQKAAVRALEGKVVGAQIQLDDSTLRAPYDGVIAKRFVEEAQNVRAKQPVVSFQDVEEVIVAVDVPETIMANIRLADIVQLMAEFSAAPGVQFPVELSEVAQTADPTTQTFRVRVALAAPADVKLLPGMTSTVTLTYRRARILGDRIQVPISAISQESGGDQVAWVIGEDQTVSRRSVRPGEAAAGQVEIVDGLRPGDRIAVAGVSFLREGMKVRDLGDALGGSSS
jgi:RND family efflux transporter MFP subunit